MADAGLTTLLVTGPATFQTGTLVNTSYIIVIPTGPITLTFPADGPSALNQEIVVENRGAGGEVTIAGVVTPSFALPINSNITIYYHALLGIAPSIQGPEPNGPVAPPAPLFEANFVTIDPITFMPSFAFPDTVLSSWPGGSTIAGQTALQSTRQIRSVHTGPEGFAGQIRVQNTVVSGGGFDMQINTADTITVANVAANFWIVVFFV